MYPFILAQFSAYDVGSKMVGYRGIQLFLYKLITNSLQSYKYLRSIITKGSAV